MEAQLDAIGKLLGLVSSGILDYALVLAAVGTITMALLELIKGVTAFRQYYHEYMVNWWIRRSTEADNMRNAEEEDEYTPEVVLDELLTFAGGGEADKGVLFDQQSSKMMGQIQAAANISLDYPRIYPNLYRFFTTVSYKKHAGKQNRRVMEDQQQWMKFSAEKMSASLDKEGEEQMRSAGQSRARLGNFVSRRLDAFQNRLEFYWARINQLIAILMGSLLLLFILLQTHSGQNYFLLVALSVAGGLVAPFAKDVVSALTGLRTRRST